MLAAPIIGAGAGGFLGGQMGMSIGWMVGSWLMNRGNKEKNQIIDPGAQEIPRFNQALRGTTLPVAFGTNRISSQIVYQGNFNTIRKETTTGGGGKGGSGGGKGAPASTEVAYNYKWDLVYHTAMYPMPYQLFGGWLAGNRLAAAVIVAIQSDSQAEFGPYAQFMLQQQSEVEANAAFISFAQGIWWPGGNQEEGWDHLETQLGQPIRWPWTGYVGFNQIDLGANPHIPQLEWEIGPGSFDADCGNDDVIGAAIGITGLNNIHNFEVDAFGKFYGFADSSNIIYAMNRDATISWSLTRAQLTTRWNAAYGITISTLRDEAISVIRLEDGTEWIVMYANISIGGTPWFLMELVAPDATDSVPAIGHIVRFNGPILMDTKDCQVVRIGSVAPMFTPDECILFSYHDGTTAAYALMPPIDEIVADLYDSGYIAGDHVWADFEVPWYNIQMDEVTTAFTWEEYQSSASNQERMLAGWFLESISPVDGTIQIYRHWYKGYSSMEYTRTGGAPNAFLTALEPSHPNGVMLRSLFISEVGYHHFDASIGSSNVWTADTIADPTEINDSWIDSTGASVIPFDNVNTTLTDGEPDVRPEGFDYAEHPFIRRLESGAVILILVGTSQSTVDSDPDLDEDVILNMRLFVHDPISGDITQFAVLQCDGGNKTDGWGNTGAGGIYQTDTIMPWFDDENNAKLYFYGIVPNAQILINDWGNINLSTGDDVLPPYIIYEIMTNAVFGLGISAASIDTVSYQAALDYCQLQEFKLSAQYRREEPALRHIERLLETYAGYLIISDGKIKFGLKTDLVSGVSDPIRTIDNDHLLIEQEGEAPVTITKGAAADTFNKVRVNFIDRSLDYKQNQVEISDEVDQDLTGIRMREFPPIYVMSEKFARTIASRTLWGNRYARDTFAFKLGWKDADLEPGDVVTLVDSHYAFMDEGIDVRINQWIERSRGVFEILATEEVAEIATNSQGALNISSASIAPGPGPIPNVLEQWVYELPFKYQVSDSVIYASYAPDALAFGGNVYSSPDGITFARIETITPMPLSGILLTDLQNNDLFVENGVEIVLLPNSDWAVGSETFVYSTTLGEVSAATRAVGGGLLWVGSEMLSYEGVNLISQNRYKFNRVYRGWGGTHIHDHSSGDRFSKHGSGIFAVPYNETQIGQALWVKVAPMNFAGLEADLSSITAVQYSIQGTHYRPQIAPQPRLIVGSRDYGGCYKVGVVASADISLDWRDTSRNAGYGMGGYGIGGYGRFATDVLSHSWRVEVVGSGDVVVRSLEVTSANYIYPGSTNAADNGDWRGNVAFRVTPFGDHGDATRTQLSSLELF